MPMDNYRINLSDVTLFPFYETTQDDDLSFSSSCFEEEVDFVFSQPCAAPDGKIYCMSNARAKHWCFTLNNYTEEHLGLLRTIGQSIGEKVSFVIFGKEVGRSGTPHLQGFVSFLDRVRLTQVKQVFAFAGDNPGHWTVARKLFEAIEYCRKEGDVTEFGTPPQPPGKRNDLEDFKTAVAGGMYELAVLRESYSEIFAKYPRFVMDYVQDNLPKLAVECHPLRDWQANLNHDLLLPADDRKIIFIVDVTGNTGKSWFCHYYASMHDNAQVILPGKKADMSYILNCLIRVLFIDAPRSKQGEFIQYDFLEDVKNGYVCSPKYESRHKTLGKVHVVVMMNEMPDESKLSRDRYDIRVI